MRGKLDSQYLESFLTAEGSFAARIPYHGSVSIDPSKFIVFISSNGFQATEDLANRACMIRINKREHYHYRTWDGKDVLQKIFELQPLFIGAVFAVINAWHEQGKQKTKETRHDFREWCQTLDWIVQNIFKEAPLMDGHEEAKERASSPQLSFLRSVAIQVGEELKLDQAISASTIAEMCIENNIEIPGLSPEKQNVEEGQKRVGHALGTLFGEKAELTIDNFKVVRAERSSTTMTGNPYRQKTYTFSLLGGGGRSQTAPTAPSGPATAPPEPPSNLKIPDPASGATPAGQGESATPQEEPRDPDLPRPPVMPDLPPQPPPPPAAPRLVLPQSNPDITRPASTKKRKKGRGGDFYRFG